MSNKKLVKELKQIIQKTYCIGGCYGKLVNGGVDSDLAEEIQEEIRKDAIRVADLLDNRVMSILDDLEYNANTALSAVLSKKADQISKTVDQLRKIITG